MATSAAGTTQASAAVAPCPAGKALYDSGRFPAAEAAYAEALKEPATEACAKAGLQELDDNSNECATATALEDAGRTTEAQAAFEKALEAKPNSKCAKAGLDDPDESFWQDPKGSAEDVVALLGLLVAGLGVFAIAVSLLLLALTYLPLVRNWWPANRIRAVRVSIESFEDNAEPPRGNPLAALVRSKNESFGSGSGNMRMVDSKAAAEETLWNKFAGMSEQAKGFGAFVGLIVALYPRRQFQVTGVLQEDSGNGSGLTLSLRSNTEISDAITLWPREFGLADEGSPPAPGAEGDDGDKKNPAEADRLQKLAVPAAAWISHVTLTASGKKPGGARTPLSWSLFKAGSEWEKDGNREKAIALYGRALEEDKLNWGALAQLGKLENEANAYEKAVEHLNEALDILEQKRGPLKTLAPRKNTDWYRIKFRLASTLANDAVENPAVAATRFDEAGKEIDGLLKVCWTMFELLPLERMARRNRECMRFVRDVVVPAALVLKAIIDLGQRSFDPGSDEKLALSTVRKRLRRGKAMSPLTLMKAVIADREDPSALLLLDFACFYALSNRPGDRAVAERYKDEAFAKTPADKREWLRARAAKDPMLKRIPGIATPPQRAEQRRCHWTKRPPEEPQKPPRPWF